MNGTENDFVSATKAQRLRIRFGRGVEAVEIGHLDLTQLWVEALSDAGVEVSYSQGNRPQPRLTFAAGLPMGVTSEGELLDVIAAKVVEAENLCEQLTPHLPAGISALECREVGLGMPSLPNVVRWAEYEIDVAGLVGLDVGRAVFELLAAESLPWEEVRGQKTRQYDLRLMVSDIVAREQCGEEVHLFMRLRCGPDGVGRASQVVKALGLPEPVRVHRSRLVLVEESRARTAWRKRGRYL